MQKINLQQYSFRNCILHISCEMAVSLLMVVGPPKQLILKNYSFHRLVTNGQIPLQVWGKKKKTKNTSFYGLLFRQHLLLIFSKPSLVLCVLKAILDLHHLSVRIESGQLSSFTTCCISFITFSITQNNYSCHSVAINYTKKHFLHIPLQVCDIQINYHNIIQEQVCR